MPDYSIIESLCKELDISVSELLNGNENRNLSDDAQLLDLIQRTQNLENQKNTLYGILLIIMGIALLALSMGFGGTDFKDFMSGILLGLSVGEMIVGVYLVARNLVNK